LKKQIILIGLLLFNFFLAFSQKSSKIVVESADYGDINEIEIPNATLLTGNVRVSHDGIVMTCNKAYYFKDENYIKAFGNVEMVQGDTLYMNSKYAEYNGNVKKALATGNVVMRSPESTMSTDTIHFDRNSQEAYFNNYGTIINKKNTLKSKAGRYYVKEKKYQFVTSVVLTNPEYTIKSNHLEYFTAQGDSYLKGPSTITGKENFIYTENGYYNSKKNIGNFKKKSYIKYKERLIEGDSLYYDRKKEFASGTNNVKITDSINKAIIKGHYGEVYKNKDSLYITKHASIRYKIENDSMFISAKKIIVTGKTGERIVVGQKNVRFFKTDLSGKCDSIHSNQKVALTKLIGKPILWNFENQMTGDVMHLIGNNTTEKLDSLKILNNTFIISKDTIGTGFNQIKGLNLYGKFKENKLYEADVVKNTEVVYYMRNDKNELIGINKNISSRINMIMDDKNKVDTITFFESVDGDIYPEKELPENARKLRGFVWRGDERIKNKEEIYPPDEVELDRKIVEDSKASFEKEKLSQSAEINKLEDLINGDDYYEKIFKKYNNRLLIDKTGGVYLIRNFKFRFPKEVSSVIEYKKNHPKFKNEIKIDQVLWNWNTMVGKKYDGGYFTGKEAIEEIELPKKEILTYEEIFNLFDDRVIIDRNGMELLVKNGKFKFPSDLDSLKKLKINNPKYRKEVRINQVLWDWNTMQYGKYDGGLYSGNEINEK
jgi:lipopolysaccharide export system protein LptA